MKSATKSECTDGSSPCPQTMKLVSRKRGSGVRVRFETLAVRLAVEDVRCALDRGMFGPDVPASLTVDEFRRVAHFRDALAVMDRHPVDKDALAQELAPVRAMFRRSLAPVRSLPAGTVLSAGMLTAKKPGTGIPLEEIERKYGLAPKPRRKASGRNKPRSRPPRSWNGSCRVGRGEAPIAPFASMRSRGGASSGANRNDW